MLLSRRLMHRHVNIDLTLNTATVYPALPNTALFPGESEIGYPGVTVTGAEVCARCLSTLTCHYRLLRLL